MVTSEEQKAEPESVAQPKKLRFAEDGDASDVEGGNIEPPAINKKPNDKKRLRFYEDPEPSPGIAEHAGLIAGQEQPIEAPNRTLSFFEDRHPRKRGINLDI